MIKDRKKKPNKEIPKFDAIFNQILFNFRIAGIPLNNSPLAIRFHISYLIVITIIIAEISFFVSMISSNNFLKLTALAPCFTLGIQTIGKILFIASKRQQIAKLLKCLRPLYQEILDNPEKKSVVAEQIVYLKSLTKYYFILNWAFVNIYNGSTIFFMLYQYIKNGEVNFYLQYYVLLPYTMETWHVWFLTYLYVLYGGCISILYYATVDALYFNLSSQVCNQFVIISNEIKNLNGKTDINKLIKIIKRHQYIIKLSEVVEEIFRGPNFCNMLAGSIEICAVGFNITAGDTSELHMYLMFLFTQVLQIFVMSYFGEILINESREIGEAAFTSEWYNMDPKSKILILTVMARCQKPQNLTAYKFSVISYQTFTKIISSSWSYFTILKTVYKPEADSA